MKTVNIGGIEMPLNAERIKRIKSALAETQGKLDKELRHPEDLQDHEMVAFYHRHLAKLNGWIN